MKQPNPDTFKKVYFLGIGGIGMSALARYFKRMGREVAGYDKTPTLLTTELEKEGIPVHFKEDDAFAKEWTGLDFNQTLVVYTPAIPDEHKELVLFRQSGFLVYKRAEVLGQLTRGHYTIAVAGTHGKTTTSTLISHLLVQSGKSCVSFLGGISGNYNSNLILPAHDISGALMVAEADEYDRSFLHLKPDVSVITSMDPDHLDVYGSAEVMDQAYRDFVSCLKPGGMLIKKKGIPLEGGIAYGLSPGDAEIFASEIKIKDHTYVFNIHHPGGIIPSVVSGLPGRHNVENALAAAAVCLQVGITPEAISEGIRTFQGVRRRFDKRFVSKAITYIDDYAHHPAELTACIRSVKELYPEKRITGIFQPHLFSRTRDFSSGFSEALSDLDEVLLMEIYPARELPIPGVQSSMLLNAIASPLKKTVIREEILSYVSGFKEGVILTLGAGDIDTLVLPIQKILEHQT